MTHYFTALLWIATQNVFEINDAATNNFTNKAEKILVIVVIPRQNIDL